MSSSWTPMGFRWWCWGIRGTETKGNSTGNKKHHKLSIQVCLWVQFKYGSVNRITEPYLNWHYFARLPVKIAIFLADNSETYQQHEQGCNTCHHVFHKWSTQVVFPLLNAALVELLQELMSCYFQSGWHHHYSQAMASWQGPMLFRNWILFPLPQIRMVTTLKTMEVPQKCKQAAVKDIVALVLRQTP
jgi:hypothetical protein